MSLPARSSKNTSSSVSWVDITTLIINSTQCFDTQSILFCCQSPKYQTWSEAQPGGGPYPWTSTKLDTEPCWRTRCQLCLFWGLIPETGNRRRMGFCRLDGLGKVRWMILLRYTDGSTRTVRRGLELWNILFAEHPQDCLHEWKHSLWTSDSFIYLHLWAKLWVSVVKIEVTKTYRHTPRRR